jgi:nucleoside phosphorylase
VREGADARSGRVDASAPGSGSRRRVAILAPMPSELDPVRKRLGLSRAGGSDPDLFRGTVGRVEVVASLTGVGMRAAAARAERMLASTSPDHLVVVGIAGGIGASVAIGDLVVPELVLDLASGETFRPAPLGRRLPRGVLASSDALLEAPDDALHLARQGVVAVDMETAAIASVCERRGCPWSVFRAISDRADDGTTDTAVFGLIGADGRPKPGAVARLVLTHPGRIRQLVRLAGGARRATRAAARAVATALEGS